MIKINLISKEAAATGGPAAGLDIPMDMDSSDIQKQGVIRLVIILLGPLLLYVYQTTTLIPGKQAAVAAKQNTLNALVKKNESAKAAVEEIKKYKADEAKLKEQINTIESLRKDRMREVRVLDLIQREMPERMWLTKIEMKDHKLNISGFAATDNELTQFMDVLTRSVFMTDVNLVRTNEKSVEGSLLKEFTISAQLKKTEMKSDTKTAGGA